jgi:hypothetical protein
MTPAGRGSRASGGAPLASQRWAAVHGALRRPASAPQSCSGSGLWPSLVVPCVPAQLAASRLLRQGPAVDQTPPAFCRARAMRRIYSDGRTKACKQGWFSWIVAIITMTIYTGSRAHQRAPHGPWAAPQQPSQPRHAPRSVVRARDASAARAHAPSPLPPPPKLRLDAHLDRPHAGLLLQPYLPAHIRAHHVHAAAASQADSVDCVLPEPRVPHVARVLQLLVSDARRGPQPRPARAAQPMPASLERPPPRREGLRREGLRRGPLRAVAFALQRPAAARAAAHTPTPLPHCFPDPRTLLSPLPPSYDPPTPHPQVPQ